MFCRFFDISSFISDYIVTNHRYCRPYCDYVTFPIELGGAVGTIIVLSGKRIGILGALIITTLPLWPIGFILQFLGIYQ